MSCSKTSNLHLGPLGTFHSGSGLDVDYVHLPAIVISRASGLRVVREDADDLRSVLTAQWEASRRMFCVGDVLVWAMDQSSLMAGSEVTSNLLRSPIPEG